MQTARGVILDLVAAGKIESEDAQKILNALGDGSRAEGVRITITEPRPQDPYVRLIPVLLPPGARV